ncbi:hypothetical protein P691DRAFT_777262 [Macrolepiota fuliginosa MF-IS2]|uniref:Protein kinase domain-containing protein n=1 Tax=Macrolepiota fuliginosa MF-IS2 TaxID=1400762 RepID=A0A9P6BZV6_9AGAR|nr:hypothetical protein P691DRAFT_777262 [Macrolepiota fuliginosa MF-IS2]
MPPTGLVTKKPAFVFPKSHHLDALDTLSGLTFDFFEFFASADSVHGTISNILPEGGVSYYGRSADIHTAYITKGSRSKVKVALKVLHIDTEDPDMVKKTKEIRGVAEGLRYLHQMDVVHGDLRPPNILMNEDGHPLLCFCCSTLLRMIEGQEPREWYIAVALY